MKPISVLKGRLLSNLFIALALDSPAAPHVPAAAECDSCKAKLQSCAHPDSLPPPIPLLLGVS